MANIMQILQQVRALPGRNDKMSLLESHKNNALLKRVILATYNPMVNYWISSVTPTKTGDIYTLDKAISQLYMLSDRVVTGNVARENLKTLVDNMNADDQQVLCKVIERDLDVGCNVKTFNKIFGKDFIPVFEVMLAASNTDKIVYPAYAQLKEDGARAVISNENGKIVARSRQGNPIYVGKVFSDEALNIIPVGETRDGELLVTDENGKILDRKTGNGIINKAVKGTISEDEAARIIFVQWDIVDFTGKIPYDARLMKLNTSKISNRIRVLETIIVNTHEEAVAFAKKCINAGKEGAVIKNIKFVWQPKRSDDLGKIKAENDADLRIVGMKEGTGKYAGKLGSFDCVTDDGKVSVSVSGMTDEERNVWWNGDMIGKIITVTYNALTQDKKTKMYSLYLPRIAEIRFDKNETDTLEELIKKENS